MSGVSIHVSLAHQLLTLVDEDGQVLRSYPVSTAGNGAGEQCGSYCTPRGRHLIRAKIGGDQAENTVFVARRPSGECYSPELGASFPERDWILTRILWLSGREPGFNRLGTVDTMRRYVYIHGSPDSAVTSVPGSHGCIRMRNADILDLFERVPPYTPVDITED
ncbi:MAG: L,D-transpeptidase [Betaproteobacteria bacterium]